MPNRLTPLEVRAQAYRSLYKPVNDDDDDNESSSGHGQPDEQKIAALAYRLWEQRGCPEGSPDEDWYRALEELKR